MRRRVLLTIVAILLGAVACLASLKDVSLQEQYQGLALKYMPTVIHEGGTTYFPVDVCFDGDTVSTNNRSSYDDLTFSTSSAHRCWTYIHILKDSESRLRHLYVQYWYYYAFNPFWGILDHDHDWELVVIVFDDVGTPVELSVGAHGALFTVDTTDVSWESYTHPIVYSASGSHAMSNSTMIWGQVFWSGNGFRGSWSTYVNKHRYTFLGRKSSDGNSTSYLEASGYTHRTMPSTQSTGISSSILELPRYYTTSVKAPWTRSIWRYKPGGTY